MEYPDETLSDIQVSLTEFVSVAQHLLKQDELEHFLRFVLAGRLRRHDMMARIFINARQGALAPPLSQYQLYRDIDSVIGITRNLPFKLPMSIFPLASFRDTLTKDNHIKYTLSYPQNVTGVPLHKIPNMALGKVGRRDITRIFFPGLYEPHQSSAIPPEMMTLIYEKCLRPAIVSLNPIDQSRWPITYSAAMTLYRDQNGQFHFGSLDFPTHLLDLLGCKLLELFQSQDKLQDAFFVHELRGTKGISHHDPNNSEQRSAALAGVLHLFDMKLIQPQDWFVDVALEIRQEGHVLQWLTKDLSGLFRCIQFRIASDSEWNDLVFGRYFPAKGASTVKGLQQFPSASYYRQWLALMEKLDEEKATSTRTLQRTWFDKFYWVPYPSSDRMWFTKKGGREWTILPPGESGNCPRLAINPKFNSKSIAMVVGNRQADVVGQDSSTIISPLAAP
ncbi:hypothetical protein P692DRAFT_201731319 [Suillus brevipes Sb2]|nr:hypothetical protein P692DRAFT_201731319 [Suillus brevipes Sb2]